MLLAKKTERRPGPASTAEGVEDGFGRIIGEVESHVGNQVVPCSGWSDAKSP